MRDFAHRGSGGVTILSATIAIRAGRDLSGHELC